MIKVYTKNGCPQCDMTKRVLTGEGIEFTSINVEEVDENGNKTEQAKKAYDYVVNELGLRSMPVVVVDEQEPFSGFQPDKLQELK